MLRSSDRTEGLRRRTFLAGLASLPGVLRLRAANAAPERALDTSVIFVQLGGGASQFETYDPKPMAPAEYRGQLSTVASTIPGVYLSETLPRQAAIMDDLAIVRSVTHREASHIALHVVETGYFLRSSANARRGEMPAMGSVVSRMRGALTEGLPSYVSIPKPFAYSGPHHLGSEHAGFFVNGDPNKEGFRVENLDARDEPERLRTKGRLRSQLDARRRIEDLDGSAAAVDEFTSQAIELLTSPRAQRAFDLDLETDRVREDYGRHEFGQRLLLARRLVEAGVPHVVVRMGGWDDHRDLVSRIRTRCAQYDGALARLITDLRERGLRQNVLVVAMGEFGRTPRVNANGGRDHWPATSSVLLAGGRYRMGQAVGSTDANGGAVLTSPHVPQSVLAMVYRHLGIDPAATFTDFSGRPRHLLESREPIRELL